MTFTSEQIAAAPPLEPAFFENMLRSSFVHENVTSPIRVRKIRNAAIFAAMDFTAEELKETCKEAFGIDASKHGGTHKVEWASVHNAWLAAKVNVEVETKVDAMRRAHG